MCSVSVGETYKNVGRATFHDVSRLDMYDTTRIHPNEVVLVLSANNTYVALLTVRGETTMNFTSYFVNGYDFDLYPLQK
jgi:hypothetical protein